MTTFLQFKLDLNKFTDKTVPEAVAAVRGKISLDLLSKIILKTPVDTGRLRNSWFLSDGQPSSGTGSAGTTPQMNVTATFTTPFESSWIVNNLPYANRIEFGHSSQAPAGMVRISIAEIVTELSS